MTRLLMLDGDRRLIIVVARVLAQEGIEVVGAASLEEAQELVATDAFDAALLDCDLLDAGELSAFSELGLVLTTSFLEPEGEHRFFRRAPLLRKPFTSAQLRAALHEASLALCAEPTMLVDVLSRAHTRGQSLVLRLGDAELFLEEGELVHAEVLGVHGEQALAQVLAEAREELAILPSRRVPRTIHRPFQALMLDLLRLVEERERLAHALADLGSVANDKEPRS